MIGIRPSPPSRQLRERGAGAALWLAWIAAGAIGATLTAFVARRVSLAAGDAAGEAFGLVAAEVVVGALALGTVMLGIAVPQWLVVRRRLAWAPWLVLSRAVGGAVGGAAGLGVLAALARGAAPGGAVAASVIVGLTALATAEWLVLRRRVAGAAKLAWVSAAALVAAVVGTGLVGTVAGDLTTDALAGCVFGTCHAAVTGLAIVPRAAERRGAVSSPPPERAPESPPAASSSNG